MYTYIQYDVDVIYWELFWIKKFKGSKKEIYKSHIGNKLFKTIINLLWICKKNENK